MLKSILRLIPLYLLIAWGIFSFQACKTHFAIQTMEDSHFRFNEKYEATDPDIDSIVSPYKAKLQGEMSTVIGSNEEALIKGQPESLLGNWVADAIRDYCVRNGFEVDFALQNYGGLRVGELPAGPINLGQIYELMPFENMLVILEADAGDVEKFFQRIAVYGGWPVSSEVRVSFNNGEVSSLSLSGSALDQERTYKIALPDYIANGGDRCDFFKDNSQNNTGVLIRDVLVSDIKLKAKNGKPIAASLDGRVTLLSP
jgi:2',3'-cyclic-nucleotide 2'-phosphodiesterase (5'-nucleotidase family)